MASRSFFANDYYDPFDLFYAAPPSNYPFPYHHRAQQRPARAAGGFFPARAEPAAVRPKLKPRKVSIPVHFVDSDTETKVTKKKRAPPAEEAAARVQAAARGFLARRAVRALRAVEREAEEIGEEVEREVEVLRGDAMARVAIGEQLMRLLLRLDAVRGARDYRRRVARRVLALQDAVDALEEPGPEPDAAAAAAEEEPESEVAAAEMEVDGDRAASDPCAADETGQVADGADHGGSDVSDNSDAEGEWEMVAEEPEPAPAAEAEEPPRQEPAGEATKDGEEAAGTDNGDLNAKKLMEMVAALCERSAQQCAVIEALADRVDALEGTVRRMEEAERRRRRAKKLKKEGKGSNLCFID